MFPVRAANRAILPVLWRTPQTQRENLALLVATMLSERSAKLMSQATALPRQPGRIDMRYQGIVRVLANLLIDCDAVMLAFAGEVLVRAQADAGSGGWVDLILDQSRASERPFCTWCANGGICGVRARDNG